MHKECYSHSLRDDVLHFAAHSHHPRPDVTREATMQCWDDAAHLQDRKWQHIFNVVLPVAQQHIADMLELKHPEMIAFAPNTHEFVARILSALDLDPTRQLRILTTTNEFHSFARQVARLEERRSVFVKRIPVKGFDGFVPRFRMELGKNDYDLVFLSHVFFDSGFRIEVLEDIVSAVSNQNTIIVIDGYHAFCAIPTSLKAIQDRVYYIAGGYKYAQYGEGACFMCVPKDSALRPENTGWFAEFGALENRARKGVTYPDNAFRFWGATFDPAGLYRLNAVMGWLRANRLTVPDIHAHVAGLQEYFFSQMKRRRPKVVIRRDQVTPENATRRGHLIAYDCIRSDFATSIKDELAERGVIVDTRGCLIRIGFGLYHERDDVDALIDQLSLIQRPFTEGE